MFILGFVIGSFSGSLPQYWQEKPFLFHYFSRDHNKWLDKESSKKKKQYSLFTIATISWRFISNFSLRSFLLEIIG